MGEKGVLYPVDVKAIGGLFHDLPNDICGMLESYVNFHYNELGHWARHILEEVCTLLGLHAKFLDKRGMLKEITRGLLDILGTDLSTLLELSGSSFDISTDPIVKLNSYLWAYYAKCWSDLGERLFEWERLRKNWPNVQNYNYQFLRYLHLLLYLAGHSDQLEQSLPYESLKERVCRSLGQVKYTSSRDRHNDMTTLNFEYRGYDKLSLMYQKINYGSMVVNRNMTIGDIVSKLKGKYPKCVGLLGGILLSYRGHDLKYDKKISDYKFLMGQNVDIDIISSHR